MATCDRHTHPILWVQLVFWSFGRPAVHPKVHPAPELCFCYFRLLQTLTALPPLICSCLQHSPDQIIMSDFTVRTRKFMRNAVCGRRQMVVDVIHPGVATISKEAIKASLTEMYSANADLVFAFGFRTGFGGDRPTGFAYIYDSEEAAKKMEPRHRLIALGWAEARTRKRGAWKDGKKKIKSTWGTGRRAAARKAKRAAM